MSNENRRLPVVFDCMIFLQGAARAASPSAACLKLVEDNRVELFLSARILAEVQDVLTRPKLQRKFPILTREYVDAFLQALVRKATILPDVPQQFIYERDPKDEPYINLAIASDAVYLVSRDNDLLDLMSDPDLPPRRASRGSRPASFSAAWRCGFRQKIVILHRNPLKPTASQPW